MGVGAGEIEIIDVGDPLTPTVAGTLTGERVLVAGERLYIDGTRVHSLADPRAPEFLGDAPVALVVLGDDKAVVQRPGEIRYLIMDGTDVLAEAPTHPIPTHTLLVEGYCNYGSWIWRSEAI